MSENPVVFISYSQDSISFSDQILEFSNKLRSEGIDAVLDQYEETPAEGWPRWTERQIQESDYVIIICSQGYYNKIYGTVEKGQGKGVKWEGNIIYQALYSEDSNNKKFIPVVFKESDYKYIPLPLKSSSYYNISNNSSYDKLYWRLRGINTTEKPPLGKLRPLPKKERRTLFLTSMIDLESWDNAVWRGAGFMIGYLDSPVLLLLYKNEEYASKIFNGWISSVGVDDKNDEIRIALVEGDVAGEPPGYYIVIGTNIDAVVKRAEKLGVADGELAIMNISRYIRANPSDNFKNYNIFKNMYNQFHEYYIMPAVLDEKNNPKPLTSLKIKKRKIVYRNLKDITDNDEDAILLKKNKN